MDLPTVKHSVPMLGAQREGATIVAVTRDGNVFVGNTQVQLADLPSQIVKSPAQGGERKGYLKADAGAKYGEVKAVILGSGAFCVPNYAEKLI
jgi:biopolymer transport protein ExbD